MELGKRMRYSDTAISFIERVRRPPTLKFAVKADEVFGTGGTFVELYRRITRAALLEGFEEFADEEARCQRLRSYETGVIPGLFQIPAYAAALTSAAVQRGSTTRDQADESLALLAARQQRILDRPKPPAIHTVLHESCVLQRIGGPEVMAEQLDHLLSLTERPNITVQVAPFSLGELVPFFFPVVLLTLPNRALLGYSETHSRGYLERNATTCAAWERDYDQLLAESLPTGPSLDLIRAVRKGLE